MRSERPTPRVFDALAGEALETWSTPYGTTGRVWSGAGIEAVWVTKQAEEVDPGWFSQSTVDLLLVVQGRLRVEYEDPTFPPVTLRPGQLLVLPPNTRCRAWRWPREATEATVFVAVYPLPAGASEGGAHT